MKTTKQNPHWWQLYLTCPLLIAFFVADSQLKISSRGHQAVQIGIVLFIYWLIHKWLRANARAISRMDRQDHSPTFRVIRLPIYGFPDEEKRPLIQLPETEIKGILSDTIDMDCIDAKALLVDDVPQR